MQFFSRAYVHIYIYIYMQIVGHLLSSKKKGTFDSYYPKPMIVVKARHYSNVSKICCQGLQMSNNSFLKASSIYI